MSTELPGYYTDLAPFERVFRAANPILTYHKLGPRPRGVRLKGLYVEAALFARQLAELRQAGFLSDSLDHWHSGSGHRVLITFDDAYANVLSYGLPALAKAGFTAIQFIPVNFIGKSNVWDVAAGEKPEGLMDSSQLREWIAAGHDIGSHSLSHAYLTRLSLDQAREEIVASRKKLEDLFNRKIEHFCYPYGDWNPAVRDLVQEAGYKTACTTESGLNAAGDSPFTLKRFTARYRSRNFKTMWNSWTSFWRRSKRA